jgi:hypothetical protein
MYGDEPEDDDRGMLQHIYTCFFLQIKEKTGLLIKPLAGPAGCERRGKAAFPSCLTSREGQTKIHPVKPEAVSKSATG